MTETVVGTGTEQDEDFMLVMDFEFEIPCDDIINAKSCDQPAEHKMVTSCCGHMYFVCTDCLIDIKRILKEDEGQRLKCSTCLIPIVMGPGHLIYVGRIKG